MRVIPVLDLMAGRAVRARGGHRSAYTPARSVLVAEAAAGDPLALAQAFRDALGCDEWYVADLDAIAGGAPQRPLLQRLAGLGGRLMVDAGCAGPDRAQDALADGAARVVVGLETLPSFATLADVARVVGRERLVFSLDLRAGRPVAPAGLHPDATPLDLARAAADAGAGALLVLDLARIGSGAGVDLDLVAAIRAAHPALELLAGGGLAALADVTRLAEVGGDAALLASALHDGQVRAAELETLRRRDRRRGAHRSTSR
ncbi:MAG TPA: HisA/HisF-related TIM barrel protein [Gemmatimonadales bacterium]|nr:HisA/HisF-related TIM barrel protein [Gemmatimonadales bacterium]